MLIMIAACKFHSFNNQFAMWIVAFGEKSRYRIRKRFHRFFSPVAFVFIKRQIDTIRRTPLKS